MQILLFIGRPMSLFCKHVELINIYLNMIISVRLRDKAEWSLMMAVLYILTTKSNIFWWHVILKHMGNHQAYWPQINTKLHLFYQRTSERNNLPDNDIVNMLLASIANIVSGDFDFKKVIIQRNNLSFHILCFKYEI